MNLIHRYFCKSESWRNTLKNQVIPWALKTVELGSNALEIGPGPGLTTDILRHLTKNLTCVEIDHSSADKLSRRLAGTNVRVQQGDVTALPLHDGSFSTVVCFTMLHHIRSTDLQDQGLTEIYRVLKQGGIFAGTDSMPSLRMRLIHIGDTMTLVNPETFAARLGSAGFQNITIEIAKERFRFRAQRV